MLHRKLLLMASALLLASGVQAQELERSSYPHGMQVRGDAEFTAYQESSAQAEGVVTGERNTQRTSTATSSNTGVASSNAGGSVQIQGRTRLTAEQKNASATAAGKDNAVKNEVGVIGGK